MEREGYVSIWLGNFPDDSALMEYAAEDCVEYDEDDGSGIERPSQFSNDFFGGMIWAFDPDFWERGRWFVLGYSGAGIPVFLRRYL